MQVAISRRIRHLGLVDLRTENGILTAEHQAKNLYLGYPLGLLYVDGKITQQQHDAGMKYAEDMWKYYVLVGIPFPSAKAQNMFAVRGMIGDETETRAVRAKAATDKMMALERVLNMVSGNGRKVKTTVFNVAVTEEVEEPRLMPERMLGWLIEGLDELIWHYGVRRSG